MGFSFMNNYFKLIRTGLISSATVIAAEENSSKDKNKLICRPSELPIYSPDIPTPQCIAEEPSWLGIFLEEKISSFRTAVDKVISEAKAYEHVAEDYVKQGIDAADDVLVYLRQENSLAPKVGAIAIGGLTGLILSLRKGFFKKTLYVSSGALAMTAICYPKETAEYSQIGLEEGKKYANIAYNFAYGVKKGDPPMELPSLPQLPSSVSEVWDSVYELIKSLFIDKADSDNKCSKEMTENFNFEVEDQEESEEIEEEVVCRCYQNEDGSIVHDENCPYD